MTSVGVEVAVDYRGGADRGYVILGCKWHKQLFSELSVDEREVIKNSPDLWTVIKHGADA